MVAPTDVEFAAALRSFGLGDMALAEAACRSALSSAPAHLDAHLLLGAVLLHTGQFNRALASLEAALRVIPANSQLKELRIHATRELCRARLRKGVELLDKGSTETAAACFRDALVFDPNCTDAMLRLGIVAARDQNFEQALEWFDRALVLDSGNSQAHNNRANVLKEIRRHDEALSVYDRALAIDPDSAETHNNRGVTLFELARFDEALASYDRAIAFKPDYAEAHFNRGNALMDLRRLDEALASYDRAIASKPDHTEAHNNRGNALMGLKRLDEALLSYDRAITLKPDYAKAYFNRGNALKDLKRLDEALVSYDRAIALTPDFAEAHWHKALLLLLQGDFAQGRQKYEWRWQRTGRGERARDYVQPLWLGEVDIRGKRILLWSEQGFGDSLQFCRYVTQVATLGALVVLEAPVALAPLLKPLAGVEEFVSKGSPLPPFDFHCPLLSLPLAFKTTLDSLSGRSYLTAPAKRTAEWGAVLGKATRPRVGLAWSGNADVGNDHNRAIRLLQFRQALPNGIEYIQVQKGVRADDKTWLAQHPMIRNFEGQVKDFGDTAALIESLDLVVTVDTCIAHLAGALGKEVWVLLAFVPDWRWLLDRSDSPWYDSATLFRQPAPGDWDTVLVTVRQALEKKFERQLAGQPPGASCHPQ